MLGWLRRLFGGDADAPDVEGFEREVEQTHERIDKLEGRLRYTDERLRVMRR